MRSILLVAWLLLLAPLAASEPPRPESPPNIVLILADDFGFECLGAGGGESYSMPALDRMAAGGMLLERCYSQPLCTPTRVQMLTGLYNQRNYRRFDDLDPESATFAQIFRKAGYRTCIAGKWQLGGGPGAPDRFGFDEHLLWQLAVRRSRYANPTLEKDGQVLEYKNGEYGPDLIGDFATGFIERNRDRPFLLFYSLMLPHPPFGPTPASPDWDPKAAAGNGNGDRRHFRGMVEYADALVGKLLAVLDRTGIRERTLVIFTGDNGTPGSIVSRWRGRDYPGGKGSPGGTGTHVPLLASWPGKIRAGSSSRDLIDCTDFFPTLAEAAGLEIPGNLRLDGRSFLPRLLGREARPREWIYSWYARDGGPSGIESARGERFKLYADGRLFDAEEDLFEERPLETGALSGETRAARDGLQRVLDGFRGTRGFHPPGAADGPWTPETAAAWIRALGGIIRIQDGKMVEVLLNRLPIPDGALRLAAALPDLTDLSLEDTPVGDAGIERLASLEKLEWINLFRTRAGDRSLEILGRMRSIKILPIGGTLITDAGLRHLESMPQLVYLGLRGDRISDAGLARIAGLSRLEGLHLGDTGVSSAGLRHLAALQRLRELWLDGTAVSDAAIEHLAKLGALRELHASRTYFTQGGLERLAAALPECRIETEGGLRTPESFEVLEDEERIRIEGGVLAAAIRKKGYVSGIEGGSFLDRKTGARDLGFGLDIADWILEPGSDEEYRGSLTGDLPYVFNNPWHGGIPKRAIEGPQICTKAMELAARAIRGRNFIAVQQSFDYRIAAPGKRTGSRWEQTLVFPAGKRYCISSDRIISVNASDAMFLRLDMPGHIRHAKGDTFEEIYLSYAGRIPASAFEADFAPDERYLYRRGQGEIPRRFIRAYRIRDAAGKAGPWLAGMTLDAGMVWEAWCHQRGYVCLIEEIGGRRVQPGESFSAAFITGFFDSIEEMERVYDEYAGRNFLSADASGWRLERLEQPHKAREFEPVRIGAGKNLLEDGSALAVVSGVEKEAAGGAPGAAGPAPLRAGRPGYVETRPFLLEGGRVEMHVEAPSGAVRVEVLDALRQPVAGFSGDAAGREERVDRKDWQPVWKAGKGLESLRGQTVRLRIHLENGRIYSVRMMEG